MRRGLAWVLSVGGCLGLGACGTPGGEGESGQETGETTGDGDGDGGWGFKNVFVSVP
jgi:hypothetical protein